MHASPYIAKKLPDGGVITHQGVSIRAAMLPRPARLVSISDTVIRYRLRQDTPGPLQLMLITNRMDGRFGGNFEAHLVEDELQPGRDGWCEISVPLERFRPITAGHDSPAGKILTSVLIYSSRRDAEFAVASFSLFSQR